MIQDLIIQFEKSDISIHFKVVFALSVAYSTKQSLTPVCARSLQEAQVYCQSDGD